MTKNAQLVEIYQNMFNSQGSENIFYSGRLVYKPSPPPLLRSYHQLSCSHDCPCLDGMIMTTNRHGKRTFEINTIYVCSRCFSYFLSQIFFVCLLYITQQGNNLLHTFYSHSAKGSASKREVLQFILTR